MNETSGWFALSALSIAVIPFVNRYGESAEHAIETTTVTPAPTAVAPKTHQESTD